MPIFKRAPIWLGESTWANRAVSPANNARQFMSDVAQRGADMRYDSTSGLWLPIDGGALEYFSMGFPVGIAPPGTFGANGAVTFSTALANIYPGALLYYPANSIFTGFAGGFRWTVCSTTTAAVVYQDTYTPGTAFTRPTSPTAFSGTTGNAYTAPTTEITAHSFNVLASLLGNEGQVFHNLKAGGSTTVNSKDIKIRWNTSNVMFSVTLGSNSYTTYPDIIIANRGPSNQFCSNWNQAVTNSNPFLLRAVDTSAQVTETVTIQLSNSSDFYIIEHLAVRVLPK